nr:hypothetical protein [Bacteroidota bacterium]
MKKVTIILSVLLSTLAASLVGQNIELTFTGDNNGQPVTLDSVIIRNVTQGGEVTLYPPDLSLVLILTGIEDGINETDPAFNLHQNYPNPFNSQTSVQLQLPGTAMVKMLVSNLLGQNLLCTNNLLGAGKHTFSFTPGNETCYFLTAIPIGIGSNGQTETIKMLCNPGREGQSISLSYSAKMDTDPILKTLQLLGELPFEIGDELLMIAYSASSESGMVKSPDTSQEYVMQFATNVACPGLDSLLYESQWYHTIQVGGQCWLKENLNVGEMILGNQNQTNNGVIEKYCYGNSTAKCDELGGLYIWDELMQYSIENRAQGICPPTGGWHIPTDEELKVLEGMVDSGNPIGHQVWNQTGWRGVDAGENLRSTSGWYNNGNGTDMYGFCVLTTGYWFQGGFSDLGEGTLIFSSTIENNGQSWHRGFNGMADGIIRNLNEWNVGSSVRCIKD